MTDMYDNDFDPLRELLKTQTLLAELIQAHNDNAKLMVELSQQHEDVVRLAAQNQTRIVMLEQTIRILSEQ